MANSWRHNKLKLLFPLLAAFLAVQPLSAQLVGGVHGIIASSIQVASGANPGLLDTITDALPAYSTRLLLSTYTGDCMQIRRASDNSTSEIGFVGDTLDVASINTFCSGTTCYVRYWYDQSGNALNAVGMNEGTNNDNLPIIYESGSVTKCNARVAIKFAHPRAFVWSNGSYNISDIITGGPASGDKAAACAVVGQIGSTPTQPYIFCASDTPTGNELFWWYSDGNARIEFGTTAAGLGVDFTRTAQKSWICTVNGSAFDGYENGSLMGNSTNASIQNPSQTGVTILIGGGSFSSRNIEGFLQEIICWSKDVNETTVYNSQDAFYSIP